MFYLNGHGGNHELAQVAARDLGLELPIAVGAGSWWAMAYDALIEAGSPAIRNIPGHAGGFETAAMMAIAGHLVREQRPVREGQRVHDLRGVALDRPNDCVVHRNVANRVSDGHQEVFVVANGPQKMIHLVGEISDYALIGLRPMKPVGEGETRGAENPQAMVVCVDVHESHCSDDLEACTDS